MNKWFTLPALLLTIVAGPMRAQAQCTTPPTINCPGNISVNVDPTHCGAIVQFPTPTATDNCHPCPGGVAISGYTLIGSMNGHYYYRSNNLTTWAAANAAANGLGGHLATISSATENILISSAIPGGALAWIGFTDQAVEGNYVWVNGEPIVFTNWCLNEPNNLNNEDHTVINWCSVTPAGAAAGPGWNDLDGSLSNQYYVVEFDCIPPTVTQTAGPISGSNFPVGTTTVTFTARDVSGNAASCSFTVTVIDNVAPTISCPNNISLSSSLGVCGRVVNYTIPTATDNCLCTGQKPSPNDYAYLGTFGGHEYYASNFGTTWFGADAAANAFPGGHLATIGSAAENAFVTGAFTSNLAWIGFTDQASESNFVWNNGEPVTFTNWCSGEPNDLFGEDYTVINWCATGSNGAGAGTGWNDLNGFDNLPYILEFDCAPIVTRTAGPASGSLFPVGTTTVTYQAADYAGNINTCSFTVTINDNELPTLDCPDNANVSCDASTDPSNTGAATATDNCGIASLTYSDVSTQDANPLICGHYNYSIMRSWTARDVNGNSTGCIQFITVSDQTAPFARCKNVTVTLGNGVATVSAATEDDGSFDNCSPVSLSLSKTSFNCSNIGNNTVTLTVKDVCGNTSTCTGTVTVLGTIPSCSITVTPSNTVYTGGVPTNIYLGYGPQTATLTVNPSGGSGFTYSWSGPTGYLSCTNCPNPLFTPAGPGIYTFTVTVTNANGCTTTCSVTFCVKDIRSGSNGGGKVNICHIPPGNPANSNTLSVSVNAVAAHLAHGDYLGSCGQTCGTVITSKMLASGRAIEEQVKVYPNPNNGVFIVEIPYTEAAQSNILVTDMQGKIVQQRVVTDNDGRRINLNLGDVAKGMYMVIVSYGDQRFRTTIVVN